MMNYTKMYVYKICILKSKPLHSSLHTAPVSLLME